MSPPVGAEARTRIRMWDVQAMLQRNQMDAEEKRLILSAASLQLMLVSGGASLQQEDHLTPAGAGKKDSRVQGAPQANQGFYWARVT